jgi:hypothetical protein
MNLQKINVKYMYKQNFPPTYLVPEIAVQEVLQPIGKLIHETIQFPQTFLEVKETLAKKIGSSLCFQKSHDRKATNEVFSTTELSRCCKT